MKNARQLLWGILITLISLILILGGVSLSLAEGNAAKTKVQTLAPSSTQPLPTVPIPTEPVATDTVQVIPLSATAPLVIPTVVVPTAAASQTPAAATISATAALPTVSLPAATTSQAKASSTSRPPATPVPCKPPSAWVIYTVQAGDTLYHLSQVFGVSVAALQKANCLGSSTLLEAGQPLYVPAGPTRTPSPVPIVNTNTPTFPPLPTSIP